MWKKKPSLLICLPPRLNYHHHGLQPQTHPPYLLRLHCNINSLIPIPKPNLSPKAVNNNYLTNKNPSTKHDPNTCTSLSSGPPAANWLHAQMTPHSRTYWKGNNPDSHDSYNTIPPWPIILPWSLILRTIKLPTDSSDHIKL